MTRVDCEGALTRPESATYASVVVVRSSFRVKAEAALTVENRPRVASVNERAGIACIASKAVVEIWCARLTQPKMEKSAGDDQVERQIRRAAAGIEGVDLDGILYLRDGDSSGRDRSAIGGTQRGREGTARDRLGEADGIDARASDRVSAMGRIASQELPSRPNRSEIRGDRNPRRARRPSLPAQVSTGARGDVDHMDPVVSELPGTHRTAPQLRRANAVRRQIERRIRRAAGGHDEGDGCHDVCVRRASSDSTDHGARGCQSLRRWRSGSSADRHLGPV